MAKKTTTFIVMLTISVLLQIVSFEQVESRGPRVPGNVATIATHCDIIIQDASNEDPTGHCKRYLPGCFAKNLHEGDIPIQDLLQFVDDRNCYCHDVWETPDKVERTFCYHTFCFPQFTLDPQLSDNNNNNNDSAGVDQTGRNTIQTVQVGEGERLYYDPRSTCVPVGESLEYYAVRVCREDYNENATVRALCEEDLPIQQVTKETFVMVTGLRDNITYFNKFCAQCNNVTEILSWYYTVKCDSQLALLDVMTLDEGIRRGLDGQWGCVATQYERTEEGDEEKKAIGCDSGFLQGEDRVINTCNVTGRETQQTGVEDQCVLSPDLQSVRVLSGKVLFKNIHCLVCNSRMLQQVNGGCGGSEPIKGLKGFPLIFGFDHGNELDEHLDPNACKTSEWRDPQGTCRLLRCSTGKFLKDGGCETAVSHLVKRLPYRLSLLLVAEEHWPRQDVHELRNGTVGYAIEEVIMMIKKAFTWMLRFGDIEVGAALVAQSVASVSNTTRSDWPVNHNNSTKHRSFLLPRFVWVNMYALGAPFTNRDDIEDSVISYWNRTHIDMDTSESFTTLYRIQNVYESSYRFNDSCKGIPSDMECDLSVRDKSNYIVIPHTPVSDFLELWPYLQTCQYIELSEEEVEETVVHFPVPHVTQIKITIGHFALVISDPLDLKQVYRSTSRTSSRSSQHKNVGDDNYKSYFACLDVLTSKAFNPTDHNWTSDVMQTVRYHLSNACMAASALCLLATIVTYCLFPKLLCVAGFNTMGLCCSLLVAQVFLFVGDSVANRGPKTVCTAIGMITHYSWLVVFAWMFICSLHVFRVFTSHGASSRTDRGNLRSQRKEKVRNAVLSLLVPALIVCVVMVTTAVLSEGTRIGYGSRGCAMDNPFAIHVPLIFVIVCNSCFFGIVVCKIVAVRRLQHNTNNTARHSNSNSSRGDEWADFVVYAKLSTLTGMFWLLMIVGEVLYNDVLRIMAIVANGCQGVFLFLSFTANRHVLKYYKGIFSKEETPTLESSARGRGVLE